MLAIQKAMLRFFALANLPLIKAALLRLRFKQTPQSSKPIQPIQPSTLIDDTAPNGEVCVEEDTEDTFAAWDDNRDEKLHQAEDYEQQGLRLLAKAALLRAAIRCDDRGETFIADELREHAQTLDTETVAALSTEERWAPTVPFVRTDAASTLPGA